MMATTQHIFELLNKQSPDSKLTSDLVKYFVDIFGTPKPMTAGQLATSCTGLPLIGQVLKEEEADDSVMSAVSSPEMSPLPAARVNSPPVSGVSPPRVSSPGTSPNEAASPNSSSSNHGTKQVFEKPSMECVKYVMGKRGGCQIVWQGHRYTRDRTRNDQTYWACVLKRPPYRCKGRISTKRSFVTSATAHNHTHQTSKSQTARLIHQLKQKVRGSCTEAEAPDIVLSCLQEFKFNEASLNEELPSYDTLVKMCKRIVKNKKKNEEEMLNVDTCTQKLLNNYTSNHFDYLLNPNTSLPMDYENTPRKSLSEISNPILSSLAHLPNQPKMTATEDLARRHSLTSAGLGIRSPLVPSQLAGPPTPSFLNGLLPSNLSPSPNFSSGSYTMVPITNLFSQTSSFTPTARSPPGSAFTSTTGSTSSLLPHTISLNNFNTTTSNSETTLNKLTSANSQEEKPRMTSSVVTTSAVTSSHGMVSETASTTRPHHEALLERGVSSITEVRAYLDDVEHLYRARISEMKLIEEDFRVFKDDSKTKDDRIKCLQREVSKLDVALKVAQEGLQKVRCTSEDKVERSLMKAFFTQYLTAPDTRKPEVLRLMTSILNYSDEELESLHHSRDKKWLSNVLPTAPFNASPQDASPGQSFSELFVSFLETEANRGSVMGSRPLNTPPLLQRANNAASRQRSPSSASFHQRSPSSASTTSTHSLPVLASKDPPVTGERPSEPGPLQQTIHSSPLVVPASLADLLSNKPR